MILIFTTHPIQYQIPLWQKLTEKGVDLEVIFLTKHGIEETYDPEFGKRFKWDINMLSGYKYSFAKVNSNADVNSFWKVKLKENLLDIIDGREIKAIWIQGWQVLAYWQIAFQAKKLNIPVWLRGESNALKKNSILKKVLKFIPMKVFFNKIKHFLFIGKANKQYYLDWGVKEDFLHFAPYCIDIERFKNKTEKIKHKRLEIRKKWNIHPQAYVFIFSGKLIDKKSPNIILESANNISSHHLHILYVGDGYLRKPLEKIANIAYLAPEFTDEDPTSTNTENRTGTKTSFVGFLNQTEISEAYLAADCLILPSDYGETWGLVVNEAYAHGIPSIVSDRCGSYPDLVQPLEKNFIFQYGNIQQLQKSMEFAITHRQNYNNEIELINKIYNYQTNIDTICKLI